MQNRHRERSLDGVAIEQMSTASRWVVHLLDVTVGGGTVEDSNELDLKAFWAGQELTEVEVGELEQHLIQEPTDLNARIKLLGFYQETQDESEESAKRTIKLLAWMIENQPGSSIFELVSVPNNPEQEALNSRFLEMAKRTDDVAVIDNAALFSRSTHIEQAQHMWKRAQAIEPNRTKWARRLAVHYLGLIRSKGATDDHLMMEAMHQCTLAINLYSAQKDDAYIQMYATTMLTELADHLLSSSKLDEADQIAALMLQIVPTFRETSRSDGTKSKIQLNSDYQHQSLAISGRASLRRSDMGSAINFLEEMIACGLPLNPDLTLAQEILLNGERGLAKKYLLACLQSFDSFLNKPLESRSEEPLKDIIENRKGKLLLLMSELDEGEICILQF